MGINTASLVCTDTYTVLAVLCTCNTNRILRPYAEYGHTLVIVVRNLSTIDNYKSGTEFIMTVTDSLFNVNTCLTG